jgi:hypothetical protein
LKWNLPNINIESDDYLILWADEKADQSSLHTNFKLASDGEQLLLSNETGQLIDSLNYPIQSTNVSYARIPNGTGNFNYRTPSFGYNNDFANIDDINSVSLFCFPNPFKNQLKISFDNNSKSVVSIYNIHGKIILQKIAKAYENEVTFNTSYIQKGMYFVVLNTFDDNSIQKIIKN